MIRVRQEFDDSRIIDVRAAVQSSCYKEGVLSTIKPGMSIAVTAGSRGISDICSVVQTVIELLQRQGAEPFVVPAMGSHGGATAEGQMEILSSLGLTEKNLHCPVKSSMEVCEIGTCPDGRPIKIDAFAAKADGIVVINRIKPHTSFTGPYESGLMKMLAIGIAKQAGAESCHQEGYGEMAANIEKYGRAILNSANILFGVAILENAFDKTIEIAVMQGKEIPDREPALLRKAKELMPGILFDAIDVLVVDWMGKNISGLGMDPHITGCFATSYASGPARPSKLVVLDLTEASHGNVNGLGVADVSTRRLFDKMDPEKTYTNALTATLSAAVRIPMIMDNQKLAIQAGIKMAAGFDKENIRLVRLKDTLHLDEIMISEAMLQDASASSSVHILSEPEEMSFDENENLF
jgi:hypothetical protein